jgi:hypothetical protein
MDLRGAAVCAIIMAIAMPALPAVAQTSRPQKIEVSGGGLDEPVEITSARNIDALMLHLCTEADAGDTHNRPFFSIEVAWDPTTVWEGEFYPAADGNLAATHILDWQLAVEGRAGSQLCDERVTGREALDVLAAHGITTDLAFPREPGAGFPSWALAAGVAGVLLLLAFAVWRLARRRT